uniref:Uncharacterized protein n=1 Tax=Cucumis melo TaxID=3656 RepID=A0A9I9E7W6_CUCME
MCAFYRNLKIWEQFKLANFASGSHLPCLTLDTDMYIFDAEIKIQKSNQAGVATLGCLLVLHKRHAEAARIREKYLDKISVLHQYPIDLL